MLPNAKKMNLKVSISPISDLWKRLRMSLGHEFIGKKGKAIKRLSVGAPMLYVQRETTFFASLSSGRLC